MILNSFDEGYLGCCEEMDLGWERAGLREP